MSEVRALPGELRYEARKEPPYWLTQNAVSLSLRRFAFTSSLFKGLRRFGAGGPDSLSEPVALRVREQTSWFGTHPESNPPKLSQSLFNKRCYLTTRLSPDPVRKSRKSGRYRYPPPAGCTSKSRIVLRQLLHRSIRARLVGTSSLVSEKLVECADTLQCDECIFLY